jgi:hypothetical protein
MMRGLQLEVEANRLLEDVLTEKIFAANTLVSHKPNMVIPQI